jgi:hypothetical protein
MSMPGREEDIALLVNAVRRMRRLALHPLALDDTGGDGEVPLPGDYLRMLMRVKNRIEPGPGQTATIRSPLPDEVLFESLATRVRLFTADRRLHWKEVLKALDRLTGLEDLELRLSSEHFWQEWREATERHTADERAYRVGYQLGNDPDGEHGHFTDIDMAYAWLYQDVVHADALTTGYFGVVERYRAAVGVFSHIAVVAIETLHYINGLVELGILDLPVGTVSDPVVVTAREYVQRAFVLIGEVGADLVGSGAQLPEELRPALDLVRQVADGTARRGMELRRIGT